MLVAVERARAAGTAEMLERQTPVITRSDNFESGLPRNFTTSNEPNKAVFPLEEHDICIEGTTHLNVPLLSESVDHPIVDEPSASRTNGQIQLIVTREAVQ